jgi:replicative DNA helicase
MELTREESEMHLVAAMSQDPAVYHSAINLGADKYIETAHAGLVFSLFDQKSGEFHYLGLKDHPATLAEYNRVSSEYMGAVGAFRLQKMVENVQYWFQKNKLLQLVERKCSPDEQLSGLSGLLVDLGSNRKTNDDADIAEALEDIDKRARGETSHASLHWPMRWMDVLEPVGKQELIIIGGRPGTGKSALMGQLAAEYAKHNRRCLYITLEMSGNELRHRFTAYQVGFNLRKVDNLNLDYGRKYRAAFEANARDICLRIAECYSVAAIVSTISRAAIGGLDVVFIDYLQLITGDSKASRLEQLSAITRTLKLTAKSLRIPIFCGSQLNRASEHQERPSLSSLRESGSIEQDADRVLLLHRDESKGVHEIIQAKCRNGSLHRLMTTFAGETTSFKPATIL